jgi:hypothetical protein
VLRWFSFTALTAYYSQNFRVRIWKWIKMWVAKGDKLHGTTRWKLTRDLSEGRSAERGRKKAKRMKFSL